MDCNNRRRYMIFLSMIFLFLFVSAGLLFHGYGIETLVKYPIYSEFKTSSLKDSENITREVTAKPQSSGTYCSFDGNDEQAYNIAITSCGNVTSRLHEAFVAVKSSLLMLIKGSVHFHIFSTPVTQLYLAKQIDTLPQNIRKKLKYTFYDPYFPDETWVNLFKRCSTQRLFIAEKIKNVKCLLYMDTDSVLLSPLHDVWKEFDSFDKQQMLAMTYNSLFINGWYDRHPIPSLPPHGRNAGVLLMDLNRIKESNWLANLTEIMKRQTAAKVNRLGDQDILNEYFVYFPEKLYTMKCFMNFRSDYCTKQSIANKTTRQSCLDAEVNGVVVAHASRQLFHKTKSNIFSVIYKRIEQYKLGTDFGLQFAKPLLEDIKNVTIKNKRFKGSHCYKSIYLFLRNILRFANQTSVERTFFEMKLIENLQHSNIDLIPNVSYYL